jgi:hypothetical protein
MARRIHDGFQSLLLASGLTIVLWFIPGAWMAVYPFRLFVTFIHEGGHALLALLTGGAVNGLRIHLDASGETISVGGIPLIIASAGYLASTIYGASLLALCRDGRNAKAVLTVTAAGILGLTMFFAKGTLSWTTGILLAIGLVFISLALTERASHFFLSFLAIQCCLNALFDLRTLFLLSATSNAPSDAFNMQRMTGLPALFWALLWLLGSLAVLWVALRSYGNPYARVHTRTVTRRRRAFINS